MKPIGTPVFRATEDFIWNSFRKSGKRHLILTGSRGSGKTTLMGKLFPGGATGMTTYAVPKTGVYLRDDRSGETAMIGVFDPALPGPENRMRICEAGFKDLGVRALKGLAQGPEAFAVIDEIGYLESGCPDFQAAVRALMAVKSVAAVVRRQDTPFCREMLSRQDVFVADLDRIGGNTGCVIMASGLSKRFGGNKLMADFNGRSMIERAFDATDGLFARRMVVTRHRDVAGACRDAGIDVILHDLPHRSDTVRLGIEAMGDMDGCVFCPGDQPLLTRETVAALALAGANDRESILRVGFGESAGSPVLFPEWCFGALASLPEGKGGGYLINRYPDRVKTVQAASEWELADADDRAAFERLLSIDIDSRGRS